MIATNAGHPCADEKLGGDPEVEEVDYQALAEFRYRLRQFIAFSESEARRAGLTPQQHQALLALKGAPDGRPLTIGELAERLSIRHHSVVGLVDRLAALGLVARSPSREDRRRVLVSVTPAANAVLHALSAAHRDELRRVEPMLSMLLARLSRRGGAEGKTRVFEE